MRRIGSVVFGLRFSLVVTPAAWAATYSVGPSGTYAQIGNVPTLHAGDIVELERGAVFSAARLEDSGAAGNPIVVRAAAGSGARPRLQGGSNALELAADHLVVEGLEITNGSSRCVFVHGDDLTLRDVVIHGCPNHGIEGGGNGGGNLTLDHVEVYGSGEGTQHHQIYVASDEVAHPGSRFRMQHCYVHDGNGGNNVKSRHERNEIYFNWIEGAKYHELELIGPDPDDAEVPENQAIENSDVVGNVLRKAGADSTWWITRCGGDGTGQTFGRYRFVNNTVILAGDSAGVFRLFDGIDALEAHNNVFYRVGTGNGDGRMVRDVETEWTTSRQIAGTNNWVTTGMTFVPTEWTNTVTGTDPAFANFATNDLRPTMTSPLTDTGASSLMGAAGHAFPNPLAVPTFLPPPRVLLAVGAEVARPSVGVIDRGAYEFGSGPPIVPPDMAGAPSDMATPPEVDAGTTTPSDMTGANNNDGSTTTPRDMTGASNNDASTMNPPSEKDGCGCGVVDASHGAGAALLVVAVGLALRRRRFV